MIEFLGHTYYIDLAGLEDFVELREAIPSEKENKNKDENEDENTLQQFSIIKYEVTKTMIEVVLTEREELDDNLDRDLQEVKKHFRAWFKKQDFKSDKPKRTIAL